MTTGDKIKQLRLERGLSQQELAAELGYTDRSSIAKIEAGKLVLGEKLTQRRIAGNLLVICGVAVFTLM